MWLVPNGKNFTNNLTQYFFSFFTPLGSIGPQQGSSIGYDSMLFFLRGPMWCWYLLTSSALTFSRFAWVGRVLCFLAGSTVVPFARCYQVVAWACGLSIVTLSTWFAAVWVSHLSSLIALRCWWRSARIFCRRCVDICLQNFEASVWWNWRLTMFRFRTTILISHMN